jgi:hypothetical protein
MIHQCAICGVVGSCSLDAQEQHRLGFRFALFGVGVLPGLVCLTQLAVVSERGYQARGIEDLDDGISVQPEVGGLLDLVSTWRDADDWRRQYSQSQASICAPRIVARSPVRGGDTKTRDRGAEMVRETVRGSVWVE